MIALDNALIDAFPDVTFAVHLCRGNHRSMWSVEGGYDAIAEQLFNDLACRPHPRGIRLAAGRHFAPLRFVPEDKVVVLGLITTKEPELEDADELKRRIDEASRYVPLDRLALSPQCGFASTLPGNLVTFDDQRAKLGLLGGVRARCGDDAAHLPCTIDRPPGQPGGPSPSRPSSTSTCWAISNAAFAAGMPA